MLVYWQLPGICMIHMRVLAKLSLKTVKVVACEMLCLCTDVVLLPEDTAGATSRRTSASHRTSVTPTTGEGRNAVSRMSVRPETRVTMYEQSVMGGVCT